jgi:hypothetical protein
VLDDAGRGAVPSAPVVVRLSPRYFFHVAVPAVVENVTLNSMR